MTYHTVVHNFMYNTIFNIIKHQEEEEEKVQQAKRAEAKAIIAMKGTKRKLGEKK